MRLILVVACLFMLGCSTANSYTIRPIKSIPSDEFSYITIPPVIKDFHKPSVKRHIRISVAPKVKSEPKVTPKPTVVKNPTLQGAPSSGILASGQASWYCRSGISRCTTGHPGGMYAAIRKDLLYLRNRLVKVCDSNNCVTVRIIDCNCGTHANLIDLYSDAYKLLAPLSTGRINVRIYK